MKKEITIGGVQYPVEFNFNTLLKFEDITKKSFFKSNFEMMNDRIALIEAAVYAADEKTKMTADTIMGTKDLKAIQDITAAFMVIIDLFNEFFELPKVVQESEEREAAGQNVEGEQAKN